MRILLLSASIVLASALLSTVFGQTCPTYNRRNNGNGGTCSSSDVIPSGKVKSGNFSFNSASDLTVERIEKNNTLVQEGSTLYSGTIFFGNLNGTSKDMCFYGNSGSDNAVPAGSWKIYFRAANNTQLVCSYNFNAGGSLSTITAGSIGSDQTICSGQTPASITSASAATNFTSYKWQSSTTSSSSGYSDISSATSATYSPGSLTQTTYFQRIAIDGTTEVASNVITVTVVSSTTWTGASSTTFETSSNWNPAISTTGCDVSIPGSLSNYPTTNANASVKNVTIASGATLTLGTTGNNIFSVTGAFQNNGTVGGTGTLTFSGSAAQTISGNGVVKNVEINNTSGVTITSGNNKLNVLGLLTATSTAGKITTNGNLTLKATETEEGMIGQLLNCATTSNNPIDGDVTVERYIPVSKRAYRFLTPGLTTSTPIRTNWQEGANITDPNDYPHTSAVAGKNPNPGYGTHITGSQTGSNGFDATITGNPSVFQFNAASQSWGAIANTDQKSLIAGEGYQIMIRGDRSRDLKINTPDHNATIIRATGTPATCSYTFNSTNSVVRLGASTNDYSFIGNPFWSLVNWRDVTKTNVSNTIYYWDPLIAGSNNRGGYVTLQTDTDNEANDIKTPPSGANNNSSVSRYLQPGQGFFVKNTGASPSVVFEESDKISDKNKKSGIFSKNPLTAGGEIDVLDQTSIRKSSNTEKVYVSLYLKQNLAIGPADGLALAYSMNYSDAIGNEDANKFTNLDENISFLKEGRRFAILGMNNTAIQKTDTIPLYMWNLGNKEYVLRVDLRDYMESNREVFILNKSTGESTKIEKNTFFDYAFHPSIGTSTDDKFAIIFNISPINNKRSGHNAVVVFPNPVYNGEIRITIPNQEINVVNNKISSTVEIINSQGVILKRVSLKINADRTLACNVEDLPIGIYTIKTSIDGMVYFNKLVKQ